MIFIVMIKKGSIAKEQNGKWKVGPNQKGYKKNGMNTLKSNNPG